MSYEDDLSKFSISNQRSDYDKRFEVTEVHLRMLKRLSFGFSFGSSYLGYVFVSSRRPYGNSNIYGDIAELAEISEPNWDAGEDWSDELKQSMIALHFDMTQVLRILIDLFPEPIMPGVYVKDNVFELWHSLKGI